MTPSSFNCYEDVSSLKDDQLRRLLADGDGTEKVWATWVLGIRNTGKPNVSDIQLMPFDEQSTGVRLNLLVLLAGHGDFEQLQKREINPFMSHSPNE